MQVSKSKSYGKIKYNKLEEEKGTLSVFLESNLPLIEKYLLADEPGSILESLEANTPSYFLIKLLSLSPDSQEFKDIHLKLNKEGILWADELFLTKIPSAIQDSAIQNQKKIQLLKKCKEKLQIDFSRYVEPPSVTIKKTLENINKLPSSVSEEDFSINQFIKGFLNTYYAQITKQGLRELGVKEFLRQGPNEHEVVCVLGAIGEFSFDDSVVEILKYLHGISKYKSHFKTYENKLTLSQLQQIGKEIPELYEQKEYINSLYSKLYGDNLKRFRPSKQLSNEEKESKYNLLVEAVGWSNSLFLPSIKSLVHLLNYEILTLGLEMKRFDIPLFINYIDNPVETTTYFNKQQIEVCHKNMKKNPYDKFWSNSNNEFQSVKQTTNTFIERYIPAYFQSTPNPEVELLYKYFEKAKVDEWLALTRLSKGDSVAEIGNILDYNRLESLRNQKQLAFVENSKPYYSVEEPVVLTLKVKNITEITAEIYEISTQKHYLSCDTPIQDTIAIDFIEPFKKITKTIILKNQFKYQHLQFDFSDILEKKSSIYIIDFVGAEKYCRAVIRKGSTVCIERSSIAGVELNFYEENGTKINQLDVWVDNKKIPVIGKYVIPFREKEEILKVVAVKNGFASLHKIRVPTEEYEFKLNYIYDKENFLVGNKAKVLLQARLELNGLPATMAIVKETVITVNITNHQGINSSFDLRNIEWNYKREYELQIPIQNPLSNIEIVLKTKVQKYKGEKKIEKKMSIYFQPPTAEETISFFLTRTDGKYLLRALGVNAEVKPNLTVNLLVSSLLFKIPFTKLYTTDQKGQISLGSLRNIQQLTVTAGNSRQSTWNLSKKSQIDYTKTIVAKIDEVINLPVYSNFTLNDLEILYCGQSNKVIRKVVDGIELKEQRLLVQFKEKGIYAVRFEKIDKNIVVKVIDGVFWERTSQIYSKDKKEVLICYPQAHNYIGLSEKVRIEEVEGKYKVKCELTAPEEINRESIRVHVFASYFNYEHPIDTLRGNYSRDVDPSTVKVETPKSSYLDNQCLSDQHCYIINREKAKKYIGNALQKPRIFLSKTQTKMTCDNTSDLGRPISYAQAGVTGARAPTTTYTSYNQQHILKTEQVISSFNGFLKHSSSILANINENNIEFEIPKHYKSVRVLVTSQSFAIEKRFDLPDTPLLTKDLRHSGLDEAKTGLTMSRNCYKLRKGESLTVNRSSVWASISGQNIYSYSRTKYQLLKGWVLGWESYDTEKKKEVYSKNICHEINTYTKYKDEEFFNSVVKPFIENKLEKTVVDYCLLEDEGALEYLELDKLQKLNPFEKCLLVDYLVKANKLAEAQALTNSLRLAEKAKSSSFQEYQLLFDTAINCKLSADNQDVMPSTTAMLQGQDNLLQQFNPYPHQFAFNNSPYQHQYIAGDRNMGMVGGFGGQPQIMNNYAVASPAYYTQSFGASNVAGYSQPQMDMFAGYNAVNQSVALPNVQMQQMHNRGSLNRNMFANAQVRVEQEAAANIQLRNQYKKAFNEIQKTKEYIETTYFDMKNPKEMSTFHVAPSKLWVELAEHFLKGANKSQFLSESFIYLKSRAEFTLAFCFIPSPFSSKYNLKSEGESIIITAQTPFLVFVKEVKSVEFKKRPDVIVTQHIYDPLDEFMIDEDGQRVEKTVTSFIKNKVYNLKTIVTNISQSNLQLQILLDIPQGSIPVSSQEYTTINSESLSSYAINSYVINFYFPESGTFKIYPSNVSKKGEVIARAEPYGVILVKDELVSQNLNDLRGILDSGTAKDVLNFLRDKNIFDPNIFNFDSIMWMLKDKEFFKSVIQILKSRFYYNPSIWSFGLLHDDVETVSEYLSFRSEFQYKSNTLSIFQYYPLSSKRAHKHLKGDKNQILNQNFKATYENFLISSFIQKNWDQPIFTIVFTYYLILQDRIQEAESVFAKLKLITKSHNHPQLQCDYIACFLDIYTGYPNFVIAREISAKYVDYPVEQWRQIFKDVYDLLNTHDTQIYEEDQTREYEIKFINKGNQLRVLLPEKTSIELSLFAINLQLFFSSTPFADQNIVISVQPFKTIKIESKEGGEQKIQKPEEYPDIYVVPTETSAVKSGQALSPFLWNNGSVKVKLLEDNGTAIVFVDGKPKPGSYCKVYAKSQNGSINFYKDGYTDLQGKFVYAASELSNIDKFAILFKTDKGGLIKQARKPNGGGVFGA